MNQHDIAADVVKASPTIAVVTSGMLGVDWPSIAYMLTALYTALLIAQKLHGWYVLWKLRRAKPA